MTAPPTADLAAFARERWDAIVVGAGPAGSTAARELARRGRRVLMVDRQRFPRDKVCGACLGGAALRTLEDAGLMPELERRGAVRLSRFRLACRGRAAELELPAGLALARRHLDAALASAAERAGVTVATGVRATLARGEGAPGVLLSAGGEPRAVRGWVVIAADGVGGSLLSGRPERQPAIATGSRIGVGATTAAPAAGYPPGSILMAVGRDGYAGAVRLESGELNLAAALDRRAVRGAGGPGPVVAALLEEAGLPPVATAEDAEWRGTPELTRRPSRVAFERVFLVGDAAGYVEPFTGEGMGWALLGASRLAEMLAEPLAAPGRMPWSEVERRWRAAHRREVGRRQRLCSALAAALRRPRLVGAALSVLAARPALAAPVVARLHGAEAAAGGATLGRGRE